MSNISTVLKLGKGIKEEIDQRLRDAGYGEYDELKKWLDGKGVRVSRSALHRYGADLKGRDRVVAHLAAAIDTSPEVQDSIKKEATQLLLELGSMRLREAAIIEKLKKMGITG